MKKIVLLISLSALLFGCGGGSSSSVITASLKVDLTSTGATIQISNGGIILYKCEQNPSQGVGNDSRCVLSGQGTGNTTVSITFTGLPTNQTYTFTDVSINPQTGSCPVTVVDTTHISDATHPFPPGATSVGCTLGDPTQQPLNLTISIV